MRKILTLIPLIAILVMSCGKQEEAFKLEKGTPAYELAQKIAEKIEKIDPDKNEILVKSKNFSVTAGETIDGIIQNFGDRANQLAQMDTGTVKDIIMSNAVAIGERKLLEEAADKEGFKVKQSEVDSIMQLQYESVGGKEAFEKRLAENNITLDVVEKSIKSGIVINELLENKIKDDDIVVTEAEMQAIFEPEKARNAQHILIDTREDTTEAQKAEALKEINAILAKAKMGENFGDLAKKYSDCPSSEKGGDLGNFSRGQMVPEFDQVVFSMNVGDISDVVETQFGYHIIKLNDIVTNDYDEMHDQLESQVKDNKKRTLFQEYLAELKEKSDFTEINW
jgi:parvulin-like peptidyl-prolyl isomerase